MPVPPAPEWNIGPHALAVEAEFDPNDAAPGFLAARHPATPFVCHLEPGLEDPAQVAEFAAALQACALRYLKRLSTRLVPLVPEREQRLFGAWLSALENGHPRFGWLPLVDGKPGSPMVSFRSGESLVLLAGERLADTRKSSDFIASGFGLQVVAHLRPQNGPSPYLQLRITSFAASLPFGVYRDASLVYENAADITLKAFFAILDARAGEISAALNLDRAWFTQLRLHRIRSDLVGFEVHGTSYDASPGVQEDERPEDRTPYAFVARGLASDEGELRSLDSFQRRPLVAHAAVKRTIFPVDPGSMGSGATFRERSPRRGSALGSYLRDVMVEPSTDAAVTMARRERPRFGKASPAATGVDADAFGQASAEAHLERLFERLDRWGLPPKTYFKFAQFPIKAKARAGIRPGPGKDGITVNARVALGSWSESFFRSITPGQQPVVTMYFAVADLMRRERRARAPDGYSPAEYFGIAADPRWVWHEIGHVMLAGNVGELELRFAHSTGDALAAVALDPASELDGAARGATFPWVFVPRRHDRRAASGWSWCGSMHLPASLRAQPDVPAFKGYWSEQILSSSLFRLYRALGGDAMLASGAPDRGAREAASDYTLYLITKAIHLLPYTGALSDNTPDSFVTALINADIGIGAFTTKVDDGAGGVRTFTRAGGCAQKLIRWAFERQGLYASGFTNGPGLPEKVDLYIPSRRPTQDAWGEGPVPFGPGEYAPVSLQWTPADGDAPWHATAQAIDLDANGDFRVTVGNRGTQAAQNVTVALYVRSVSATASVEWHAGNGWTACAAAAAAPTTIAAGATEQFGPFALPQGTATPFVALAVASCVDDKANIDATSNLPCATLPVRIADLVAGDNNLGLRLVV